MRRPGKIGLIALAVFVVSIGLAVAAVTVMRDLVTGPAIEKTVKCLAEDLLPVVKGGRPYLWTATIGIVSESTVCAQRATYKSRSGKEWDASAPYDYKGIEVIAQMAREGLKNPEAVKALYLLHKSKALREIKRYTDLKEELLPLLENLPKYFLLGKVDELKPLLALRRTREKEWRELANARQANGGPETGREKDAYAKMEKMDRSLRPMGISSIMVRYYEWPLRRNDEGGPDLVAAWAWVLDDFIASLKAL